MSTETIIFIGVGAYIAVMLGVGVVAGRASRSAVERVDPNFREGAGI